MELHDHSHLRDAHRDNGVFVILSWSLSGAPLEPSNQAHIFRHLYVIMLLILGNISLTFGFDLDYRDHTFDDGWFHVTPFPTYHISDAILGHISISIEIYRFSWSCMLVPTYEIRIETMTLQWSLCGAIQLSLHLLTLRCHHASFRDTLLDMMMDHLRSFDFFDLSHICCHTGAYSVSDEIYRSLWSRMIFSTYEIHTETRTCSLFYHDPPVESSLSHSVRPALFDI